MRSEHTIIVIKNDAKTHRTSVPTDDSYCIFYIVCTSIAYFTEKCNTQLSKYMLIRLSRGKSSLRVIEVTHFFSLNAPYELFSKNVEI